MAGNVYIANRGAKEGVELTHLQYFQIRTMADKVFAAANYHYGRMCEAEQKYKALRNNWKSDEEFETLQESRQIISLEFEAYISQVSKFKSFTRHFLGFLDDQELPPNFEKNWKDIIKGDGPISLFRNKWTAHRSADDPRKNDDIATHLTVLFNLERPCMRFALPEHELFF